MGGENFSRRRPGQRFRGSSPRGRGKLADQGLTLDGLGLIPAWAGKTGGRCPCLTLWRAHPRVGGENFSRPKVTPLLPGSSPRGRGKPSERIHALLEDRLIPAWAGKTEMDATVTDTRQAHPRVGGENFQSELEMIQDRGSSPRGRGKPQHVTGNRLRDGLIPAWAGKTETPASWATNSEAHPRVGGENELLPGGVGGVPGSSPRGRGKRRHRRRIPRHQRLIPAWAGKTPHRLGVGAGNGLIPAWAGKTSAYSWTDAVSWAHPRVGGENAT